MEKHEKVTSFPGQGSKNLRIYSWYSLPYLKHDKKRFIRIPSLSVPEMRHLGTFLSILSTVTMETMAVTKISTSVLATYLQVL